MANYPALIDPVLKRNRLFRFLAFFRESVSKILDRLLSKSHTKIPSDVPALTSYRINALLPSCTIGQGKSPPRWVGIVRKREREIEWGSDGQTRPVSTPRRLGLPSRVLPVLGKILRRDDHSWCIFHGCTCARTVLRTFPPNTSSLHLGLLRNHRRFRCALDGPHRFREFRAGHGERQLFRRVGTADTNIRWVSQA